MDTCDSAPGIGDFNRPLSIPLDINCALVGERFEPKEPVIAAHAALIDAAKRQPVFQVMGEKSVDRHATR